MTNYIAHQVTPGIPTTIKTKGVNITTIVYLRVLIIQTGSTIILMVAEAQGNGNYIVEHRPWILPVISIETGFVLFGNYRAKTLQ